MPWRAFTRETWGFGMLGKASLPAAPEEMKDLLEKEQFMDAILDWDARLQLKQSWTQSLWAAVSQREFQAQGINSGTAGWCTCTLHEQCWACRKRTPEARLLEAWQKQVKRSAEPEPPPTSFKAAQADLEGEDRSTKQSIQPHKWGWWPDNCLTRRAVLL